MKELSLEDNITMESFEFDHRDTTIDVTDDDYSSKADDSCIGGVSELKMPLDDDGDTVMMTAENVVSHGDYEVLFLPPLFIPPFEREISDSTITSEGNDIINETDFSIVFDFDHEQYAAMNKDNQEENCKIREGEVISIDTPTSAITISTTEQDQEQKRDDDVGLLNQIDHGYPTKLKRSASLPTFFFVTEQESTTPVTTEDPVIKSMKKLEELMVKSMESQAKLQEW